MDEVKKASPSEIIVREAQVIRDTLQVLFGGVPDDVEAALKNIEALTKPAGT